MDSVWTKRSPLQPHIMGIVNVTPDSFFDGGKYTDVDAALGYIEQLIKEGASSIDLGAQSTRPGATWVGADEELRRLEPILNVFSTRFSIPLSVDTVWSKVAQAAFQYGATLINDVSSGMDPQMFEIVAKHSGAMVLMHMQGMPTTMQQNPHYDDVVAAVFSYLEARIEAAQKKGVTQLLIDPGIGFGKTLQHNLTLLNRLDVFKSLKYPLLIGTSRKSFIGAITQDTADNRLEGSLASVILAAVKGASVFRVHDVNATRKALQVAFAIMQAS